MRTFTAGVDRIAAAVAVSLSVALSAAPVPLAAASSPALLAAPECSPDPGFASCVVFASYGVDQRFTVPDGVTGVHVTAWGAGGGGAAQPKATDRGGGGGFAQGLLAVAPGEELLVIVGSGGSAGRENTAPPGAYGGGGAGGRDPYDSYRGGSGGGRSAVQLQPGVDAITAGGGGGMGGATAASPPVSNGGGGGGPAGEGGGGNGAAGLPGCAPVPDAGGKGGTQDAGGAGGVSASGWGGSPGTAHQGGVGGPSARSNAGAGGGGGGGYFGGGGGAGNGYGCSQEGAGGGGSGYVGGASGGVAVAAVGSAPARSDDPHYAAGIGVGGSGAQPGGNGLVVLQFSAPPTVAKDFAPAHIVAGEASSLTITLTNPNTGPLPGTALTDDLPPGVVVASPASAATTCGGTVVATPGQTAVSLSGGTVPPAVDSSPGSCTISVAVVGEAVGAHVNTLPAGAITTAAGVTNADAASATLTVDAAAPALTLVKSSSVTQEDQYVAGEPVVFTFVVTNSGNVPLADVGVSEVAFTGSGPSPVPSCPAPGLLEVGAQLICTAGYTITAADAAAGALRNDAVATGATVSGAPVGSAPFAVVIPATSFGDATLHKTVDPSEAGAGQQATYRYTITNTGNEALHAVAVAEDAFTGTGAAPVPVCPDETLYPGQELVCTATYTVTQADVDAQSPIGNTAHATAIDATNVPLQTAAASAELGVPAATASLHLEKTVSSDRPVPAVFLPGNALTYRFVVTNTGNVTLSSLALTEVAFSGHGAPELDCASVDGRSLAPGESASCTGSYAVDQTDIDSGAAVIINTAEATAVDPQGAPVPASTSTSSAVLAPVSALGLSKAGTVDDRDGDGRTGVGDVIHWSFVVSNTGATTIEGIAVADPLGGAVSCDDDELGPGATTACRAPRPHVVTERDAAAGSAVNIARADGNTLSGLHVESEIAGVTVPVDALPILPGEPGSPGRPQQPGGSGAPGGGQVSADEALAATGATTPTAWPGVLAVLTGIAFLFRSLRRPRGPRRSPRS